MLFRSLVDLQAFSGHRDTRMLLRYTHLCMPSLAKKLDAAFAGNSQITLHHGMRRLRRGATVTMKELAQGMQSASEPNALPSPESAAQAEVTANDELPSNVVRFVPRKAA